MRIVIASWCMLAAVATPSPASAAEARRFEHVDLDCANPSYSGNPFDLVATATFTHQGSGEQRVSELFYKGGDTWTARFTGTRSRSYHSC